MPGPHGCTQSSLEHSLQAITIPGKVDLAIGGFSCKSLSALNPTPSSMSQVCSTSETFNGIRSYAKVHKPRLLLLENVPTILRTVAGEEQMPIVNKSLGKIGFKGQSLLVTSNEFLLPQNRPRVYMFFKQVEAQGELKSIAAMQKFKTSSRFEFTELLSRHENARVPREKDTIVCHAKHDQFAAKHELSDLSTLGQRREKAQPSEL